jgi:hypothetical protein
MMMINKGNVLVLSRASEKQSIRLPPLDREKRVKGGRAKIDPWVDDGKGLKER